jgi:hypothetical protein
VPHHMEGHAALKSARAYYTVKPWRTCLEDAIGCLPSVAHMWQRNVIDFDKANEKRTTQKSKEGGKC